MQTHTILPLLIYTSMFSAFTLSNAKDFPPCNEHDKAVLLRIKTHFGGLKSGLHEWENNTDCCFDWSYVGCASGQGTSAAYGHIRAIYFSRGMGLSGTIPSDFGHLPYLNALSIAENVNVTGTILVLLTKLKELNLSLNSLLGSIPEKLFGIKTLQRIDLSGNRFSREIPSSVSSLSSLVVFNVSNNTFSGSIPKMPKSLKNLNVGYNQLCGPIPSGLNRFSSKSLEHNKCLCGPPC